MTDTEKLSIPPEELRLQLDASTLPFDCTDELVPLTEFVGQDRAVRSLQFGLGLEKPGYNIFVTGLAGTGKATAILEYIQRTVEERRRVGERPLPSDWCYVYNFDDPDRPNAIRLPAGLARKFRLQLEELLAAARSAVSRAFASEDYEHRRREILEQGQQEVERHMEEARQQAERGGFLLKFSPVGVALVPVIDGKPITAEVYAGLDPAVRKDIDSRQQRIMETVAEVAERVRALEREVSERLRQLDRQVGEAALTGMFDSVIAQNEGNEEVVGFLQKLREFTLANIDILRERNGQPSAAFALATTIQPDPLLTFRCNVFVDNSQAAGPPIIVEPNPNWTNLFGKIERRGYLGTYVTDHTMLKSGSIHRANGGYIILNLIDVLTKPGAWDGLKRVMRSKQASVEDPMEQYGLFTPQALRPEPIPIDLKVVVTGDPLAYILLSTYDEEFWEMFKVKADFDIQIPRTQENILAYAGFICAACQRDNLRHFDRTGVARVVEHGSRVVDDQEKLSARFGRLRDLLVEADYWAAQAGSALVQAQHVERAIGERVYRLNLIEERIRELIARGVIIVDVTGAVVGQINGLSVLEMGEHSFGRPSRITARTFLGQRGVVSIDRESQLSGRIHDKGVLILSGHLGSKYAQDKPLSLSASISFEQAYEPVEGDSASLAELCAILSSLADVPLRQDLAITGSVNQKGEVQPIGGVNQKIEGFHDVCRVIGFSGQQGVVIPSRNRKNLMLREDVLDSVRQGRFHIYAIDSLDQALELLTGLPAGERQPDGAFPEGSVNARVDARLRE
ncbi:MAG TPA: AAA family ATPase, partial [Dehalococcoidia bacterium]|nr:AAA family ATPase [Dehalococcoidia bacterium]